MGKVLAEFIKRFGRKPKDQLEWLQFRFKFAQESGKGQILTPDFNKKKPWHITEKKADVIELDEPLINEFAGPPHGYGAGHGTADPTQAQRIRQGFSTQSKLNSWSQNQRWVKDFIGRKNAEFNFLNKDDQKKVLDMFEVQIKKHMPKERKAGGGIAGMLGEPTYADDNHRVPYGGGGAGKPPVTFTLQGGGSYGSNEIGSGLGLDVTQSGYGFDLGTEIGLPWGFSATGGVGIGRGKTEVDYNDQNVFSGVDETKLGDKWNVGLKWSKKFNEGGRVPYKNAKLVDPGYFMYQEPAEDRPSRYEYNPGDSRVKREMERLKKELIEAGIIERKIFSEADRMPASNPYFLEFMEEENLGTGAGEATPEELEEYEKVLRSKQEVKDGGRIGFKGGGKGKVLEGLAKLMDEFFPGTTKLGQTSKPMADKTELKRAIAGFREREKAAKLKASKKLKIWENPDKVRAAVDDIFSSGDYKMDAEMAAEALVENNPKAFGGKLIDDIDDATRSEVYGAVLRVVQSDLAKALQLKRLSKPTKTLEGIKKTGTINISDPNVADEFTRFMKEVDPKGHKKLEQTVDLLNLDTKGKKGHAEGGRVSLSSGGVAGMLGE